MSEICDFLLPFGRLNSELYLVKEPDNPKDELAIAAYLDNRRIGYVSADDNCKVWMFLSDERTPCKVIQ